jgi:hypothetical protein
MELINFLIHSLDQDGLYDYIKKNVVNEEKQNKLFFEYRVKKGIKEIQMNKVTSTNDRIIKLWESSRYSNLIKEADELNADEKTKVIAMLYVYNLERNKEVVNEWLLENKTIKAIETFKNGGTIKSVNYDGTIYVAIIEELIKQRNINEFSKIIQMFHFFEKKYWKLVADILDKYYYDESALSMYIQYLQHIDTDFETWVRAAEILYTQEKWDDCLLLSEKASQLNSHNFRPIELMLLSLEKKNDIRTVQMIINEVKKQLGHSQFIKSRER